MPLCKPGWSTSPLGDGAIELAGDAAEIAGDRTELAGDATELAGDAELGGGWPADVDLDFTAPEAELAAELPHAVAVAPCVGGTLTLTLTPTLTLTLTLTLTRWHPASRTSCASCARCEAWPVEAAVAAAAAVAAVAARTFYCAVRCTRRTSAVLTGAARHSSPRTKVPPQILTLALDPDPNASPNPDPNPEF